MNHFRKTAIAAAVSALATGFLASLPAYAHKVNDKLEVNAKVFVNAVSVDGNATSAADDAASGFHFNRAYVETRYHADADNMVRITLDQKTDKSNADATKDSKVFVKYLYWQHKLNSEANIRVGQNQTPLVDHLENEMWGHRYVQKTFTDSVGAQTSSDLGVSILGDIGDQFEYHVSLMNGEGYQHTPDGAGYAFIGRIEYHTGGFHLGLFGHTESDRSGTSGYDPEREAIYAWWENDQFRFGGQYLMADDSLASKPFDSGNGYNILANVKLPMGRKTAAFARYDTIDKKDNGTDATLTVVGVESEFAPGVMLALDFQSADPGTTNSDSVDSIGIHGQFKY